MTTRLNIFANKMAHTRIEQAIATYWANGQGGDKEKFLTDCATIWDFVIGDLDKVEIEMMNKIIEKESKPR